MSADMILGVDVDWPNLEIGLGDAEGALHGGKALVGLDSGIGRDVRETGADEVDPVEAGLLKAHGEFQAGTTVALDGQAAGWLTATAFSPYLGHHVAYALFETAGDWVGRQVTSGDDRVPGETLDLPFYDPES